jgi:tRNA uridine 5-carboxymethylaminomethyl modification enzyme
MTPTEAASHGLKINQDGQRRSAYELLSFPDVTATSLSNIWPELKAMSSKAAAALEIEAGYAVYVERQEGDIIALRRDESLLIPEGFDFDLLSGLSNELKQKLKQLRPASLGHAARIEGMTPAASALLLAMVRKQAKSQARRIS